MPLGRPDHAVGLADMAIAIRDYRPVLPVGGGELVFLVGINSGPAVAGVISTPRFQYDIWGDIVNTASRMESHGVAGEIQISSTTHRLLGDDFRCRPRGSIELKGKAPMETWILEGRNSATRGLRAAEEGFLSPVLPRGLCMVTSDGYRGSEHCPTRRNLASSALQHQLSCLLHYLA